MQEFVCIDVQSSLTLQGDWRVHSGFIEQSHFFLFIYSFSDFVHTPLTSALVNFVLPTLRARPGF